MPLLWFEEIHQALGDATRALRRTADALFCLKVETKVPVNSR